jgi:hypothetical protein
VEKENAFNRRERKVFSQSSRRESPAGFSLLRKICGHLREIFLVSRKGAEAQREALRALRNL